MKYLIIYLEVEHLLNFLSQIEKGDLLDVLIKYAKDEIDPKIENKNVLNVFNFLRSRLDEQFAKSKLKAKVARDNGSNGGRPPKTKPKGTKKNPTTTQDNPPKPTGLLIPDFIEAELWNDFIKMRNEIKKPLSETSVKQNINKLIKFENNKAGNANEALRNAIAGSWQGLFEPKPSNNFNNNNSRLGF